MCRITGIVSDHLTNEDVLSVKAMCNALRHGGPDDEGIYVSSRNNVAFGHRRLSIIDLSRNGHQPMANADQTVVITFNGEIYNYRELKARLLKLGAAFQNDTDTEVIIQAYKYWGAASFSKLRGMFAFALHDIAQDEVYLVRDTAGIKPLYYHADGKKLIFASEIRAFKQSGINYQANNQWPVLLLAYGHIPEPHTTLQGVLSLPKGHYLHRDKNGQCKLVSYTLKPDGVLIDSPEAAREIIRDGLQAAVKRQLIADAPIGVFLSGGIDSSLLSLLANEQVSQLKTVSIFFNEKQYDERWYQQTILNKLQGENFTHLVKQQDFERYFQQIVSAMDMPTTDGINSWFISKYANENGLKAVLSGVGADELFGGYPSFSRIKYLGYIKRIPFQLLRLARHIGSSGYKRLSYLGYNHIVADYLTLRGLFSINEIAMLTGTTEQHVANILFADDPQPYQGADDALKASWLETNIYMQNQLLHDTDTMSMSHGLEVRVPFLDEELTAAVAHISPKIRFANLPKKLLVESFADILPEAVWNRPKMGFTFPLQQWMRENEAISHIGNYQSPAAKKMIADFNKGQMHWSRAFALYQIQGHV
ncbi:asparagine synthase (glutamine-hydrolyzing) [Mucilaginibacter sp. 44-25]|uniref:asparagine synthase (glutamine-hydrolyzing) n=1 Tax=Mucilaginibacter sp. 44-25 TaxID=1895794 RepID=UPI000963E583|nr:asparagine synthase (glutamine-hydrolyzing) [Mucilaginibacter sp. 44-25]OJW15057.1 MAG: asparagine synthase (glutamine-hydrolyzing) [Mucilaginibacter sp. 44-25]